MRTRIAVLLVALSLVAGVAVGWMAAKTLIHAVMPDDVFPMPVPAGSTGSGVRLGITPCGLAYMEVVNEKGWDFVLWWLDDRVIAVVIVTNTRYLAFVDSNLNGLWDYIEGGPSPTASMASSFYARVAGCESMTGGFR